MKKTGKEEKLFSARVIKIATVGQRGSVLLRQVCRMPSRIFLPKDEKLGICLLALTL